MAKDFNKANSSKVFDEVAKKSDVLSQSVPSKMINETDLIDHPRNGEDVSNTADLEKSMLELGFTDPIEVTSYGVPDGKYMILSGHRRRRAAKKLGIVLIPCIIKRFDNDFDVYNYVLLSNNHRDSSRDPVLLLKRTVNAMAFLRDSGFKGSIREEIAARLGVSVNHADRYMAYDKIIKPVWELISEGSVAISSLVPLSKHSECEQGDIYNILMEGIEAGIDLTRTVCSQVIKGYRDGKKTFQDVFPIDKGVNSKEFIEGKDSGLPLNSFIATEPSNARVGKIRNLNDEIRREIDPVGTEFAGDSNIDAERLLQTDYDVINATSGNNCSKSVKSNRDDAFDNGKKISKSLTSLTTCFNDYYSFDNIDMAESVLREMKSTFVHVLNEMCDIGNKYERGALVRELYNSLKDSLSSYEDKIIN